MSACRSAPRSTARELETAAEVPRFVARRAARRRPRRASRIRFRARRPAAPCRRRGAPVLDAGVARPRAAAGRSGASALVTAPTAGPAVAAAIAARPSLSDEQRAMVRLCSNGTTPWPSSPAKRAPARRSRSAPRVRRGRTPAPRSRRRCGASGGARAARTAPASRARASRRCSAERAAATGMSCWSLTRRAWSARVSSRRSWSG